MSTGKKIRVQFDLDERDIAILDRLKGRGAVSRVEVVRTALRRMDRELAIEDSGASIIARRPDGHEMELIFIDGFEREST